jgi:distribution and morphology protein 12
MSVDLNWETLTTGPDGAALAESIRDFIHERFQAVTLPRFIKTVSVHTFEFGSVPPEIEIKDICDPLPDFYEENDQDRDDGDDAVDEDGSWRSPSVADEARTLRDRRKTDRANRPDGPSDSKFTPAYIETRAPGLRSIQSPGDLGSPFFGASKPGVPGGTSNLNYFHTQLASGLSGSQTPLAAVAGAHLPHGWPDYSTMSGSRERQGHRRSASGGSVSPPSSANSAPHSGLRERGGISALAASSAVNGPPSQDGSREDGASEEPAPALRRFREQGVEDLQTVFRVRYSGDVKLSLTVEILLDYPMPSFVGIPVKLNITGFSFDGVAVLAYIRKRVHFCFLSPDDALTAISPEGTDGGSHGGLKMGGLLQEIKVESEIGQRENGKQSLKNVGKVEKFVLEQVRRIFEDEFVYPSFWAFLI